MKRESTASAFLALNAKVPAEQPRQLAADGQTKSGAAVAAARAAVRLLKGLENCRLFIRRNTDPAVAHGQGKNGLRFLERRVIGAPARVSLGYSQFHLAALGELECVRQQILQNLVETLRIGANRLRN